MVGFDLGTNTSRLDLIMEPDEVARVTLETGDIGDLAALEAVLDRHGITRVIHLAALQLPFCRADPPRGAYVNVLGTANVFEAVKRRAGQIEGPLVLASTAAIYEPVTPGHEDDVPGEDVCTRPMTHYGVYKVANEGTARVYWADEGVASVALRPYTVYGPARDQGVTAAPTIALAAAMKGEKAHIPYGGRTHFNYAPDVARALVAAMRSGHEGALSANLAGAVGSIEEFVAAIEKALPEAQGARHARSAAVRAAAGVRDGRVRGAGRRLPVDVAGRRRAPDGRALPPEAAGMSDAATRLRAVPAAVVSDVLDGLGLRDQLLPHGIGPLQPGQAVCGPAFPDRRPDGLRDAPGDGPAPLPGDARPRAARPRRRDGGGRRDGGALRRAVRDLGAGTRLPGRRDRRRPARHPGAARHGLSDLLPLPLDPQHRGPLVAGQHGRAGRDRRRDASPRATSSWATTTAWWSCRRRWPTRWRPAARRSSARRTTCATRWRRARRRSRRTTVGELLGRNAGGRWGERMDESRSRRSSRTGVLRCPSVLEGWRIPAADGGRRCAPERRRCLRTGSDDQATQPSGLANIGASYEIVSEPCPAATKERRGLSA